MVLDGECISLSGMLTVGTVPAGCAALLAALARCDAIKIDMAADGPIDVAGLQLLESASHYAAANGKQVVLSAPASGHLRALLEAAGFLQSPTHGQRAFWLHEEK